MANKKIVLIRHGESVWNKENLFTGWTDVSLSEKGCADAKAAGQLLQENGFSFDVAYTSVLQRAIKTLNIVLEEMGLLWIDVHKTWLLDERHYGALQGLNKAETAKKYGEHQVEMWRRSYDVAPPALSDEDPRLPVYDKKYQNVAKNLLPHAESLKDTVERVVPFWEDNILPLLNNDKKIIIAAHGNSLRALVKHIDNMSADEISAFNIPTAVPLVYEFDENQKPLKRYYLGDQELIKNEMNKVKNQGKADN